MSYDCYLCTGCRGTWLCDRHRIESSERAARILDECERNAEQRNTAADLERWRREFGDKPAPEPAWAKAICWTRPGCACTRPPKGAGRR